MSSRPTWATAQDFASKKLKQKRGGSMSHPPNPCPFPGTLMPMTVALAPMAPSHQSQRPLPAVPGGSCDPAEPAAPLRLHLQALSVQVSGVTATLKPQPKLSPEPSSRPLGVRQDRLVAFCPPHPLHCPTSGGVQLSVAPVPGTLSPSALAGPPWPESLPMVTGMRSTV